MVNLTRGYSSAANQAGTVVERTAELWSRGVHEVVGRTNVLPKLPRVDLVPPVERYFDFVQRTVDLNRGVSIRCARTATAFSDTVRRRTQSAGDVARRRAESAGTAVRGRADALEQVAREQAAHAAKTSRRQAVRAERADQERAREAGRTERERARQARQRARHRYEGMTKAELSDALARRDLPKTGNVDDLVERLMESDGR